MAGEVLPGGAVEHPVQLVGSCTEAFMAPRPTSQHPDHRPGPPGLGHGGGHPSLGRPGGGLGVDRIRHRRRRRLRSGPVDLDHLEAVGRTKRVRPAWRKVPVPSTPMRSPARSVRPRSPGRHSPGRGRGTPGWQAAARCDQDCGHVQVQVGVDPDRDRWGSAGMLFNVVPLRLIGQDGTHPSGRRTALR